MSNKENTAYGGQAVIEGVMFAGKTVNVTAVRRKNDEIEFLEVPRKDLGWVVKLKKIPFLRGMIGLIEAAAKGSQHLNFSAEMYAEDEDDEQSQDDLSKAKKQQKEKQSKFPNLTLILGVAVIGVLSFVFSKLVFTLFPVLIEEFLFSSMFESQTLHTFIEGIIKIIFLVIYILAISQTPLIKRLFQYHGAEHKVISAFEAGKELTVKNVQKFSTLHYRCGSSFMVLSVFVGVVVYSLVQLVIPYEGLVDRMVQRIVLLPVVIGASYEFLKLTNSLKDVPVLKWLGVPGLLLQKLTTKQPNDQQVEVAIASFNRMRELDQA